MAGSHTDLGGDSDTGLTEKQVQHDIITQTSHLVNWYRNNVGLSIRRANNQKRRFIYYGIGGVGGSDLIGIVRLTGKFIACEVKSKTGKPTAAQIAFLNCVRNSNGIGVLARSPRDVIEAITEAV